MDFAKDVDLDSQFEEDDSDDDNFTHLERIEPSPKHASPKYIASPSHRQRADQRGRFTEFHE